MTLTVNDLIEEAARLLTDPVDLSDWQPLGHETETLEQHEEAEAEERMARWQRRLDAYLADRADRLALLRHVRQQALVRAANYDDERRRWERKRDYARGLADYCERCTRDVLVIERRLAGLDEGHPYRVELANGVRMGLKVTRAVEASVDELAPEWVREKVSREPDKVAIKKALDAGQDVHGARLVVREHVDWGR